MTRNAFQMILEKAACLGISVAMAACMLPCAAMADEGGRGLTADPSSHRASLLAQAALTWTPPSASVSAADIVQSNVVTVGGHGSSVTMPEMLGLNSTVIANALVSGKTLEQASALDRLGVFGSAANVSPNPYLVNKFYNFTPAGKASPSAEAVVSSKVTSTVESSFNNEEEDGWGVPADLALRPDIVMGITGASGNLRTDRITYNASTSDFKNFDSWRGLQSRLYILNMRRWTNDAGLVGKKNSDGNDYQVSEYYRAGDNAYDPIGLDYISPSSLETSVDHANALAYAARLVMQQNEGKAVRYGDPLAIANDFERYVKATKWYVLSKIADGTVEKKSVAVVSRVSGGTIELLKLSPDGSSDANGTVYRALEAVQDTVDDYAATLDTEGGAKPADIAHPVTVNADQLTGADVIICLPQWTSSYDSSASNVRNALHAAGVDDSKMPAIFDWAIPNGTYENNILFGSSDESALLVGLLQGFVYPDQIDPVDMMAYFSSRLFHLHPSSLKGFVEAQLDGVSLPSGVSASDDRHYINAAMADVDDKLAKGASYYYGNKSEIDAKRPKIASSDALDDAYGIDVHNVTITVPAGATCAVYDDHGLAVDRNPDGTYTLDASDPSSLEVSLAGYRMDPRVIRGDESNVTVTIADMIAVKRVTFSIPDGASVSVRVNGRDVAAEPDGSYLLDRDADATFSVTLTGYESYTGSIARDATSVAVNIADMKRSTVWTEVTIPSGSTLKVIDSAGKQVSAVSKNRYPLVYGLDYTFALAVSNWKTYTQTVTGGPAAITVYKSQMTGVVLNKATIRSSDITSAEAKSLQTITLGSKVKKIAKGAFAGCTALRDVTIGGNVTAVGASSFSGCAHLSSISVGAKVKKIGRRAFANCVALSSFTAPGNMTTIGPYAFSGCKGMRVITVKTTKLVKGKVVGSLANSSVKTVKVSVGKARANKSYVKKYKKIFTKANCGRAVKVKK